MVCARRAHLLVLVALAMSAWGAAASKAHLVSFQGPFGSSGSIHGWKFMGSAVVTESYVRLTPAEAGHEGAIWSTNKMPFKEWEMELQFKVSGARYLGGDGFALWFTEQSEQFGTTFGNTENFVGVGVILDTYDNDGKRDNPSISAITSSGTTKFDHDSDGRDQRLPGAMCKINFRNSRNPVSLKVTYQDGALKVWYDLRSKGSYTECFSAQVAFPDNYFVGISAHTGQVADNHDIFSVNTVSRDPLEPAPLPTTDPVEETHSAHESQEQAREWRKDDDRHLQRFADAVQRWNEMTPEARQKAREIRDQRDKERERGAIADAPASDTDGAPAEASGEVEGDAAGAGAAAADVGVQQESEESIRFREEGIRFREEVSATLSLLQAEVKQIAHEMRGTITLAHAAPSSSSSDDASSSPSSASAVISEVGELVHKARQAVEHEVSSTHQILRSDVEALRKDLADLHNSVRTHVLRNGQETSSKLSQVANDVTKMSQTLADLSKRHDFVSKKLDQKEQLSKGGYGSSTGDASSAGYSLTTLLLTHLPWVGFIIFQSTRSRKKDLLPGLGFASASKFA